MTNIEFDISIKELKGELLKNEFLKTPSIYILEKSANKLLSLLDTNRNESGSSNNDFLIIRRELDIFIADLPGELNHDYKNQNKRYKDKWSKEKRKLDDLILQIRRKLPESE